MRLPIFYFLLGCVLILSSACNRNRAKVDATGLPPKLSTSQLLQGIEANLYQPQHAELKGDASVSGAGMGNLKFAATVRMRKDSAFWFSLRKFGFEGARGLVTADSVVLINRLQREALVSSSSQLPKKVKLLPIDMTVGNLTAAFAGQPIGDWRNADMQREPGRYVLTDSRYPGTRLVVDANRKVPIAWHYQQGEQYGQVLFDDFRPAGNQQFFPYKRSLAFSKEAGDTSRVLIEFNSLTDDAPLRYPISVPTDYGTMAF